MARTIVIQNHTLRGAKCVACNEANKCIINLPCKHITFCKACLQRMAQDVFCGDCRQRVFNTREFFFS